MMRLDDVEKRLLERFPNGFPTLSDIPQPYLLKDSEKASERVARAIRNGEKITIIGDYDVDGVTSSSISYLFFREIGYEVEIIIPNRFRDGYGITPQILERVDADLIITVDNGIHAFKPAEICIERGIDLIITDHHNPSEKIPDAFAVVNPKQVDCEYPHKTICGAQVIWLLLAEVKKRLGSNIDMGQFIDLVAVAIISDVMPITDLNHSLVKAGLKKFVENRRDSNVVFLEKLKKSHLTSEDIAFQLSPRLNSSGRMEDAITSFQFLTSSNYLEATHFFEKITSFNEERKSIEREITERVISEVDSSKPAILFYGDELHEGVIGIVASRIVEKFGKPAFIFSKSGDILKGSARSLGNIDIFHLLTQNSELFLKWGGHKMAGGLSMKIENWNRFCEGVWSEMSIYEESDFIPSSNLFGELDFKDLNPSLIETLDKFEPFGNENEKPLFFVIDALIINSYRIGSEKQFQKMVVEKDGIAKDVLVFRDFEDFIEGERISFSYRPTLSTFKKDDPKVQLYLEKLV
jgi:single-stranded-DNA-specific exonuclease